MKEKGVKKRLRCILTAMFLVAAMWVLGISGIAVAFEIPTGISDIEMRWDNTLRYTYGVRVVGPDPLILRNVNTDDGDRNFNKGTVTNRLDILSEYDFRFKKDYGVRFSGAAWYDQRYHDPLGNDSVATSNHLDENGNQALGLPDGTKRWHGGPNWELLDAFGFGKVDVGEIPLHIKVGRHTLFWGEGLLGGSAINGLSYSQFPVDFAKALQFPGIEAKELFRPTDSVSVHAQLTPTMSLQGQYFLEFEPYRYGEPGSYLWPFDMFSTYGGESLILGPGVLARRTDDITPNGRNEWGIAWHWAPTWLGGDIGLYYRTFADKQPQFYLDLGHMNYFLVYPDHINLYAISFSKELLGVSIGLEYNYRTGMPLNSDPILLFPGQGRPGVGETAGARGNVDSIVFNLLGLFTKTPLWDSASWAMELTYVNLEKLTQGEQYFMGRDGRTGIDTVTRSATGIAANFAPTWFSVLPGVNLSMPLSISYGLDGNSVLLSGDDYHCGNWSGGFELDIYNQKYLVDLKYTGYFGDVDPTPTGNVARGFMANLRDRDFVSLTFKTAF